MGKKICAFVMLSLVSLFLIAPVTSFAASFRGSEEGTTTISANENVRNLYVAGNTVNSDANVGGDLAAAGTNLNLNGSVEQSLFAAGSNVNIRGTIGNSARMAGGTVNVDAMVNQDLLAVGGTIDIFSNSNVSGDLLAAGGNITINGVIDGNAWLVGENVTINGKINGNITVRNVNNLKIGSDAVIGGKLTYYSPNEAEIASGAQIGSADYKKVENRNYSKFNFAGMFGLASFFAMLITFITILVLIYLFPKSIRKYTEDGLANIWANLGWGFVALVVAPVSVIILFMTFVGVYLGLIMLGIYLLLIGMAKLLSFVLIGAQLLKWLKKGKLRLDWLTAIVGALAVFILGFIPILGWIILFGFMLVAMGQLVQYSGKFIANQR